MYNAEFFGTFDVASLVLTLFVAFFFALVVYLRREDRREGYPLEDDTSGRTEPLSGFFFTAKPKTFLLAHGAGEVVKPNFDRDGGDLRAGRRSQLSGTPLQPVGDPMLAGVGPGAYARRAQRPDLMAHGHMPKLAPLRAASEFFLDRRDPDPRGAVVLGVDKRVAGVVSDVWIDRAEMLIRYLEVELQGAAPAPVGSEPAPVVAAGRRVLLPMTMAVVRRSRREVVCDAITAVQFADVPRTESAEQVTFDEEERITAYYGGGYLYATPQRSEPLL